MPSTFTTNLGVEKPGSGEQSGTWGTTANTNYDILDRAINGSITLSLSGTSSTLTTSDGTLSDGQYKLLILGGSPSGTHTITIAPNDSQKIYFVYNTTAQSVVFTQGSGGNVTVLAGDSSVIYSNGGGASAAVVSVADHLAMSSVRITGGVITGITDLAVADGGTGASDAATARTNLGLTIGTNVQAYDAGLQSIAGLTTLADRMIYTTASDVYAVTPLTAAGRNLLDDADAAAQRTTLGLVIGTNVQAYNAGLQSISGLAVTDGNIIVGNGTTWVAESGATARTSLGLGTIATQNSDTASITGGAISGATINNAVIGGTTPADGFFSFLNANVLGVADGVRATPSISFFNDTDTGFYRLGTNRIGVSTGNDLIANFQSTGDGVLNMGDHAARTNIRTSSTGSHTPRIQVEGTGSGSSASIIRNSTSQNAPAYFSLGRSKGAVDGDNTILANGDVVGTFQFVGADGTNLSIGALIRGAVDGTPALDSVPMELSFRTLAQGDTTVTERMLLTSNGQLRLFNTGVLAIADDDGTLTTGTYTPTPLGGNFKRLINGGAFTLAAPTASEDYTLTIQITNNATAGAITLSGFSKTGGDSFTTTDGHDFFVFVTKCNGFTSATVQALQ